MKKLVLALTAAAAFSGSALAADLPARTYSKAPAPVVAPSWTGFYLFGGGGYGTWTADEQPVTFPGGVPFTVTTQRAGGHGYFGTVGAGYDWQFNGAWVAGVFADGQFGSIRGTISDPAAAVGPISGNETLRDSWAAGVRVGYLVAPNVYSYVNGGYSGAQFSGSTLSSLFTGVPIRTTGSFTRNGWFVGGGVENSLNIFGISAPGWFMKTEYRAAEYSRINDQQLSVAGVPFAAPLGINFKPWVETFSTSLVYRFNWTGPVVAKY